MQNHERTAHLTLELVEEWNPAENYDHESKFQNDLEEYLDEQLNATSGMAMGSDKNHVVHREHGKSNGDVVVDDVIGIELKRNLSNSQTKKLRGQIESYQEEYSYVIVCACGIEDMSGWRELQNKYENNQMDLGGFGVEQGAPVRFVEKNPSNYGTATRSGSSSTRPAGTKEVDQELERAITDGVRSIEALRGNNDDLSKGEAVVGVLRLLLVVVVILVLLGVILQTMVL